MLVDTHSHLNFKAYDEDRDEVIKRLQKEGVVCIDVGTKYETSKKAIELAEKHEDIFASIGMHPIHINPVRNSPPAGVISNGVKTDPLEGDLGKEEFDKERYKELAKSKKVVAVGEIGLDYYYRPKGTAKTEKFKQKQKEVFIQQLGLAEEMNLPVIIHCRSAFDDLYEILKSRKLRGVIHCFSGNWQEAKKYLDLGFYIGINGIIYKLDLREVIEKTPLDRILIETDCPYLTPSEAGVERNEPIFVKYIAEEVAKIKNISPEKVAEITTQNAKNLFGI